MKPLCIFHLDCSDGFAAACVVREFFGDEVDFHPGVYQTKPPDVTGRDVIMVDFSFKLPVIQEMAKTARSILILDHHKSAAEDLAGFPTPAGAGDMWRSSERVRAVFDMNRSGAGITWDFFFPEEPRPAFINYVEDRDLWRKKLAGGDEFTIALRSYPFDFEVWEGLMAQGPGPLIEEGRPILRYYRQQIEEFKAAAYPAVLAGYNVMAVNVPKVFASEVAGEIAGLNDSLFGVCFYEVAPYKWEYSLRSRRDDIDVSEVAKRYGGGGHAKASGFTTVAPVHTRR